MKKAKEVKEEKLPKLFKRQWIKALRSGKYQQDTGSLKDIDFEGNASYCCLGVAAEIAGCKFPKRSLSYIKSDGKKSILRGITKVPLLIRGDEDNNAVVRDLVDLNDNRNADFNTIADYIQKNL